MSESDMPANVARALRLYLALEPRSLNRLAIMCGLREIKGASLPSLKRWSARYGWQQLAAKHDRAMAASIAAAYEADRGRQVRSDLAAIAAAKERFRERVLIDPNDPTLTPAQRRRALNPTLRDMIRLIRLERELLGGKVTASPPPLSSQETYTAEELQAMMAALAQVRHGLPRQPR